MQERRKLVTENDLIEAPAQLCINCSGLRYIDGMLCPLCDGEGKIVIVNRPPRLSLLKWGIILCLLAAGIAYWIGS